MTLAAYVLLAFTILVSSFVSGVFGMAGGMILLGVLLNYFDVAERDDPVLDHPVLRQWLARLPVAPIRALADFLQIRRRRGDRLRRHVRDQIRAEQDDGLFEPRPDAVRDRGAAAPLAAEHRMARRAVHHRRADHVIQVLAGVGGLFLDIFFQKSMLDRKTTNATKATVQSLSHIVRIAYFGTVSGMANVPKWALAPAIALAIAATSLAPLVIERMTDHGFRQWTRRIIFAVSTVYLIRGGVCGGTTAEHRNLLARPQNARDPQHVGGGEGAVGGAGR